MRFPAAAAAVGVEDDLDDSDEGTVEEAFDDGEEVDDGGKDERQKPRVASSAAPAEGSNEDSALSTSSTYTNHSGRNPAAAPPTRIPNLNGGAGGDAVAVQADGYVTPQRKRQRTEAVGAGGSGAASAEGGKPAAALEDSRRLFQRLWTDEDEIVILQGFLDFTSRRGSPAAHHHDTGPFYHQIRARLQLDFNKSQLVEKLRRLKKKYRNVTDRMTSTGKDYSFKSHHDQATFELSRKIWGGTGYSRGGDDDVVDDLNPHQIGELEGAGVVAISQPRKRRRRGRKRSVAEVAATAAAGALVLAAEAPVEVKVAESRMPTRVASVPNVIQETVRSSLSPMFEQLLCSAVGGRMGGAAGAGGVVDGLTLSLLPLGLGANQVKLQSTAMADDKWRKQRILELEVFSKRMELVQEQIKLTLRELRSAG